MILLNTYSVFYSRGIQRLNIQTASGVNELNLGRNLISFGSFCVMYTTTPDLISSFQIPQKVSSTSKNKKTFITTLILPFLLHQNFYVYPHSLLVVFRSCVRKTNQHSSLLRMLLTWTSVLFAKNNTRLVHLHFEFQDILILVLKFWQILN